jgi:S1-C subfamily serine protease
MSQRTEAIAKLAAEMKRLGSAYDLPALSEAAVALGEQLAACPEELPEEAYIPALEGLRRARAFKELATVGDQLWRLGYRSHKVLNFHCHALIELRQLGFAIGHLEWIVSQTEGNRRDPDFLEATGLLGRAYKQLFLDEKREPRAHWSGWALQKSIATYHRGYDPDNIKETSWHAVNVAALIELAKREGVACPKGLEDSMPIARTIIERLPSAAREQQGSDLDLWIPGTIGGAHAALGEWDKAAEWYGHYVRQPGLDAHKLFGSIRQLEDVWGLKPTATEDGGINPQGRLIASLKAKLSKLTGGHMLFSARDIRELLKVKGSEPLAHQSVLGEDGPLRVKWLRTGLECSHSVARILKRRRRASQGTGFLVKGSALSAALGDEMFLLTNSHVISNPPELDAVTAEEAIATFDSDPSGSDHSLEIVWQSPVAELDATLLRITPQPKLSQPLIIAPDDMIPEMFRGPEDERDAYVIGHPGSDDVSISLHDTDLIDIGYKHASRREQIFIRYRTPTKPGNSGSPVFEHQNWQVIGLHHMGAPEKGGLRRLSGQQGFSAAANEGIAMRSIRAAIAAHFGVPAKV